jgi:hypothetical protein
VSGQEEGGSGSGTSMAPVMGEGNREGEVLRSGRFQRQRRGEMRQLHGARGK